MRKTLSLLAFAAVIGIAAPAFPQYPYGGCQTTRARVVYGYSSRAVGYAGYAVAPCAPCVSTFEAVEPCAPATASVGASVAPCGAAETVEPCAPVTASCAPCEATTTTNEYTPIIQGGGAVVLDECAGGACPIRKTARAAATTARAASSVVAGALERLNATRARYGLTALKIDATLESTARQVAGTCAASGTLRHGYGAPEILAQNGQGIETAITQWLNSPQHRAILLNGGYRYAGVAVVKDSYGRSWCAVRFR